MAVPISGRESSTLSLVHEAELYIWTYPNVKAWGIPQTWVHLKSINKVGNESLFDTLVSQMHAVTGPLETGTYVATLNPMQNGFAVAKSDSEGSRYAITNNPHLEGARWHFEKLGNDVYRIKNKDLPNIAPSVLPHTTTVGIIDGLGICDWIIKETDVKGQYYGSPVGNPTLFVSAKMDKGDSFQGVLNSEKKTIFKVFRVDE